MDLSDLNCRYEEWRYDGVFVKIETRNRFLGFWVFGFLFLSLTHSLSFSSLWTLSIFFFFFPSKFSLSSFLSLSSILEALSLCCFFFGGNPLVWVGLAREKIHTWMMLISYHHHHGRHSYMHESANGVLTRHGALRVRFFFFCSCFGFFVSLIYRQNFLRYGERECMIEVYVTARMTVTNGSVFWAWT